MSLTDDDFDGPEVMMSISIMAQMNILARVDGEGIHVTFIGADPESRAFTTIAVPVTMSDEFGELPVEEQKAIFKKTIGATVTQFVQECVKGKDTPANTNFPQSKASA